MRCDRFAARVGFERRANGVLVDVIGTDTFVIPKQASIREMVAGGGCIYVGG